MKNATFGAGCFWGVEEAFRTLQGVQETSVGYSGGRTQDPTYQDVCSDTTGHAEVVQITFDPAMISYQDLLDIFWRSHNPTELNRQGPDIGSQYRSIIFYHDDEQKDCAEKSKKDLSENGLFSSPIVTLIEPAQTFYPAEDYHQKYLAKRGLSSCSI